MPIYVYRCPDCGNQFDKLQPFNADSSYPCSICKAEARRVLQPAGIVFKGSGWYITDSRKEDAARAAKSGVKPSTESSSDGASSTAGPASESGAASPTSTSESSTGAKESIKPAETITSNPT